MAQPPCVSFTHSARDPFFAGKLTPRKEKEGPKKTSRRKGRLGETNSQTITQEEKSLSRRQLFTTFRLPMTRAGQAEKAGASAHENRPKMPAGPAGSEKAKASGSR